MGSGWERIQMLQQLGTTIGNTLAQREKSYKERLMGRQTETLDSLQNAQRMAYAERARQMEAGMKGDELTVVPVGEARELDKRGIYEYGIQGTQPQTDIRLAPQPEWIEKQYEPKIPTTIRHKSDKDKDGEGRFKAQPWYVKYLWMKSSALMWAKSKHSYDRNVLSETSKRMSLLDPGDISAGATWLRVMEEAAKVKGKGAIRGLTFKSALQYPEMQYVRAIHEQGVIMPKDEKGDPKYPKRGLGWIEIERGVDAWKNHFAPKDSNIVIVVNRATREVKPIGPKVAAKEGVELDALVKGFLDEGWEIAVDARVDNQVPERTIWQGFKLFFGFGE